MARVLDIARRLAWEHRKLFGADTEPRRQWCVDTWADKRLTAAQVQAAHKMWSLLEGGYGGPAAANYNRVDGGLADPHARMMAARSKRAQVEAIMFWLGMQLASHPHLRRTAVALFDPHRAQLTVEELCAEIGCGKATNRAAQYVGRVLDQLAIKFHLLDAEEAQWAKNDLTGAG